MKIFPQYIDAVFELKQLGREVKPQGDGEVFVKCPYHEDDEASLSLNTDKGVFVCFGCRQKGDTVSLLAKIRGVKRNEELDRLDSRYEVREVKIIDPDRVTVAANALWKTGRALLSELHARGVTDAMAKKARLGYHDGRITIPIFDRRGHCRNLRLYSPGAKRRKLMNTRGYSRLRMYRPNDLKHQKIWICGGELKALAVGEMLNKIGAVSTTGGEGSWDPEWSRLFDGKDVWVCMDIDTAGEASAMRVANQIHPHAKSVRIIRLPLDETKYPKGDVSDYIGQEGATAADLLSLMDQAPEHEYIAEGPQEREFGTRVVEMANVLDTKNHYWRLTVDGVVRMVDENTAHIPKAARVHCSRDQNNCHRCPVSGRPVDDRLGVVVEANLQSQHALKMLGLSGKYQLEVFGQAAGVPECKAAAFQITEYASVTEALLTPELRLEEASNSAQVKAYFVDEKPALASMCTFSAKIYSHPVHNHAVLVVDNADQTDDMALPLTESELNTLEIFQPREWTVGGINAKLEEFYRDLESNVTRVYGRRDAHLVIDLTYHSALFFELEGKRVNGWVNSLLIGDTSQGKTEMRAGFMRHYQTGEVVDCKNASIAGIFGGVRQVGNRWYQSWGTIPMNDRRFVFLEEAKGLSTEELGRLTEMRSSGIAEIQKIEAARTAARTRLCFMTNPRNNKAMQSYQHGVESCIEFMGSPEDLRRFDIVIGLGRHDIGDHWKLQSEAEHVHTSDLCCRLVRWAWTLSQREIRFSSEALASIRNVAGDLRSRYSEQAPLVDSGSIRAKVARLAVALAIRTFSYDKGLIVRSAHVKVVGDLIRRCYDAPVFGYDRFSKRMVQRSELNDEETLRKSVAQWRNANRLFVLLMENDFFDRQDVEDVCDVDRDVARSYLSDLLHHNAITKASRGRYQKTQPFIQVLPSLLAAPTQAEDDF